MAKQKSINLTPQERRVLRLLALTGKRTDDLAKLLGTTERTVKYHIGNVCEVMGVDSRIELVSMVLRSVVKRLAEIEGAEWPKKSTKQTEACSDFLSVLFDGSDDDVAPAFTEERKSDEFKAKPASKKRRKKHQPGGPYDWGSVDWSLPKTEIARQLGCSRSAVYIKHRQLQKTTKSSGRTKGRR